MFLQWKGTDIDACFDFQCVCSTEDAYEFHYDGDELSGNGTFQCPRCKRVWQITHHPEIIPADEWKHTYNKAVLEIV